VASARISMTCTSTAASRGCTADPGSSATTSSPLLRRLRWSTTAFMSTRRLYALRLPLRRTRFHEA
jgi:hypothetical protein